MKKPLLLVLTLFLTQFAFGQQEKDLVRESFENYKSAVLENRGSDAPNFLSSRTLSYYDGIIHHAIKSDSATIDDLPFFDKFTVLLIRHYIPKEEIVTMDAKTFLKYSVEKDLFGKESYINSKIGEVKISGKFAQGKLRVNNKESTISYDFYKEDGEWKFDLLSVMKLSTGYIMDFIDSSDYTINEFIFAALLRLDGKEPKPTIWQPIIEM
ncbi:hypothetical protein [Algoriphagus aquimarinus]|uniref:hypothetical protein n=1 Tax=Algoriphagus aquimarinus TaxID=237018 RepID=UPI0030DAEBEE|tara:strand:- start:2747 stop:3379 length:633 start_codon:yes stop_codon:yes gene_type:complete